MPAMHVAKITRRHGDREYSSHLVRRSYREGGRVRHETIANVSKLPPEAIEALTRALRGEALMSAAEALTLERSLPAGHVECVLAGAGRLGLARLLDRSPSRERDLALAMICQRVICPGSKLETTRLLSQSTLACELGVEGADPDELYAAMDWLSEHQERIESRLAARHLKGATLVLYDLSSSYFEGRHCPLAKLGYSRDGKRGTLQITYGLLCDPDGRPIAVEVFEGNTTDSQTVAAQIVKLKQRFGLGSVIVVCDRGMVTKANVAAMGEAEGIGWITALKAPQVKRLVTKGDLQLSLFDEANLAEISSDEFPGERLVVCRNPLVAAERTRKRSELLAATERGLAEIRERVEAGTLTGAAAIGLAVGPALKRYRMRKHFEIVITDDHLTFSRKEAQIEAEAALDGFYVLRTSAPTEQLATEEVVRSYKQLKEVERAFRTFKGPLEIRPIGHRLEDRVRAHVFICMLSYYLAWHLREAWAELLFKDECPPTPTDPVAKASRSVAATEKAQTKRTTDHGLCHSFESLISELGLRVRNTIHLAGSHASFEQLTEPSTLQARALELIASVPKHA
jgi:Transposase DDE domain